MTDVAVQALAAAFCMIMVAPSAIMEGLIVCHAVDGMSRNPEVSGTLRTSMIIGCSLVETTAIYTLLVAILIIFVL